MAKRRSVEADDESFEIVRDESDGAEPEDQEVSNATQVPLFAGAGFANNSSIAKLRLVKLDNPGAGYKGEIPLNSTLETIGQIFGDGLYNIEAVNAKGRMLRRLDNQRISLGQGPNDTKPVTVVPPSYDTQYVQRIENLATSTAREREQQAERYQELVTTTVREAASREREFMTGAQQNQQAFMAGILQAQQQGFQQLLVMMTTGHQHMMEQLTAARRSENEGGSSTERMLALFLQGLNMGRELDSPDESPFWQQLLQGGAAILANPAVARQLGASNVSASGVTPFTAQARGADNAPKDIKRLKKLKRLAAIEKAVRDSGIDPDDLLRMLRNGGQPTSEPDEALEIDAEESDSESEGPVFIGGDDSDADTQ